MEHKEFPSNGFDNHYDRETQVCHTSMSLYACLDSILRVELSRRVLIEYMINECAISSCHQSCRIL